MVKLLDKKLRTDIPNYDQAVVSFMSNVVDELINLDPLLGKLPNRKSVHTGPIRNVRGEKVLDQEFEEISATANLSFEDIKNSNIERFTGFLTEFSDQLIINLRQGLFLNLTPVLEMSGQTIKNNNESFSYDTFLDALEMVELEFDESGNPIKPTMVLHPKLLNELKSIELTEQQVLREKRIIDKKREEYYAKKRYRRLSRSN